MKRQRLFESERTPRRRSTTTALMELDTAACPVCGSHLERITVDEPVLFRHGGHGATRRTIKDVCTSEGSPVTGDQGCGWAIIRSVQEIRPE